MKTTHVDLPGSFFISKHQGAGLDENQIFSNDWFKSDFFKISLNLNYFLKGSISKNQITFDIQITLLIKQAESKYKFSTFLNFQIVLFAF